MSVIYIVLPLALVVIGVAVAAFLWAVRSGQFDDVTTPAMRALQDDPPAPVSRAASQVERKSNGANPGAAAPRDPA